GAISRPHGGGRFGRILARYEYVNEEGVLLYEVIRFEPKDFRFRRPDGRGNWIWGLGTVERVLYRLPSLRDSRRVVLVEGEKDADNVAALGLTATTGAGGSEAWRDEYADQLVNAGAYEIVILPDHDAAGEKYARAAARSCVARGLVVKIVRLPGLTEK